VASGRDLVTFTGVVLFASLGFALGAGGSALRDRDARAEPYRKMRVEHEGQAGMATRTRVLFQTPGLPISAVELSRDREGRPLRAQVSLRDGGLLVLHYAGGERPSAIEGSDGARAELDYAGGALSARFVATDGGELGSARVDVPAELSPALELAHLDTTHLDPGLGLDHALAAIGTALVPEAHAQPASPDANEERIATSRDLAIALELVLAGPKTEPGRARVEAKCSPLSCIAEPREIEVPGRAELAVAVSGSVKRGSLGPDPDAAALGDFEKAARAERRQAQKVLPDVAAAIAAVGATSLACRRAGIDASVCAPGLGKSAKPAGAAIIALSGAEVPVDGAVVDERARALYLEDRARAALDAPAKVEVCVTRDGYADACTSFETRPFGVEPPPPAARAITMRRRVGGNATGSFSITQNDGPDCSFSPSPRTRGPIRLAVDGEQGRVTASLTADERGSRPNLGCSLGTANMSWTQNYTISASQSLSKAELERGGPITLRMSGTMSGAGSYSFSNCRSSSGASATCPGGKRDTYNYPVEITGTLDLERNVGSGMVVVRGAPLSTAGTWNVPGEKLP
jgi:hypothetical protein